MYFGDYVWFMIAIAVCMIFSAIANGKVHSAFNKNDKIRCRSGMTGYDTVVRLMKAGGVFDIGVGRVQGKLSDHYDPSKKIVNLSDSTYESNSIASVAVAAHEMGHVMQNKNGYIFYRIRTAIVPIVNFGSRLAMPLVFLGLVLDFLSLTANANTGFYIAMIGVILYGGSLLFALVTLPVELDASRRAKSLLISEGILSQDEISAASEVLSAAAMTYLASLLTSLVYFLRFLVHVLTLFGKRDDRR